ncbi:hypothetical protein C8R43DRAFT_943606 [Mycena crocata]|nr:hypothetical protein C8R43DRAFT_943606 [Mycena crocata]
MAPPHGSNAWQCSTRSSTTAPIYPMGQFRQQPRSRHVARGESGGWMADRLRRGFPRCEKLRAFLADSDNGSALPVPDARRNNKRTAGPVFCFCVVQTPRSATKKHDDAPVLLFSLEALHAVRQRPEMNACAQQATRK